MDRFNLSAWGVRNGALTLFAMMLLAALGAASWQRLGRAEDPSFTLKVMVVTATWQGATAEEMQSQVADRIESRLQDLPWLDRLETFARPGVSTTTVVLRDTTPRRARCRAFGTRCARRSATSPATCPPACAGPYFNDEYSDVYSAVLALTGASNPELVRQAERVRLRLLRLPGVEKVAISGRDRAAHLRGGQPRAARHARHPALRHRRRAGAPEPGRTRRRGGDRRARCTCGRRRAGRLAAIRRPSRSPPGTAAPSARRHRGVSRAAWPTRPPRAFHEGAAR
jgi:hypothetical protein